MSLWFNMMKVYVLLMTQFWPDDSSPQGAQEEEEMDFGDMIWSLS